MPVIHGNILRLSFRKEVVTILVAPPIEASGAGFEGGSPFHE
jgi:hypothetical protein